MASKKMEEQMRKLKAEMENSFSNLDQEIEISTVDVDGEGQTEVEVHEMEYDVKSNKEKKTSTKKPDVKTTEEVDSSVIKEEAVKETVEDVVEEKVKKKKSSGNKALEIELEKQKELAMEYQDKYQRLLAEFENARTRNERETSRMYSVGAKDVLEKLLPVVDNFERAISIIPEEDINRAFEQGVDKIYKQMMTILTEIGVEPMNAAGTGFNPDLHNAVMHIEDEEFEENVVVEELQKGYMYKENVLRHSMVKVAN